MERTKVQLFGIASVDWPGGKIKNVVDLEGTSKSDQPFMKKVLQIASTIEKRKDLNLPVSDLVDEPPRSEDEFAKREPSQMPQLLDCPAPLRAPFEGRGPPPDRLQDLQGICRIVHGNKIND